MIGKWLWTVRLILRRLWVRVVAMAILAVLAATAAPLLTPLVPTGWIDTLGGDALDQLLNILATSMLAVTTFSLSIAVNAYNAAAASATPRATALLQEDETSQTTLATFLGAFVYAIVAIIELNTGYYADSGRVVLFGVTVFVLAMVVIALLRWIGFLPDFGRMENTLERVEDAAGAALQRRLDAPYLGGQPSAGPIPDGAWPIPAIGTGYVQHVDMEELQAAAAANDFQLWLSGLPGDFVHPTSALVHGIGPKPDDAAASRVRRTFTIARRRSFDQDPIFGMIVLSEIASRALSPGVNDPGTAIAVIGRQTAVLSRWKVREGPEVICPRIHVPSIAPDDLLDAAFRPILRNGVGQVEVLTRLIVALQAVKAAAPDTFTDAVEPIFEEIDARIADAPLTDWERQQIDLARGILRPG